MRIRFNPKAFRLGMRTFKTGLSVFIVLLLFKWLGWQGMQIASLTAVFSLREDFDKSLSFGFSRVLGNTIGGIWAMVFYLLNAYFDGAFWVTLVFVPILTMLTIMVNVAFDNKAGIIGGVAAMLIITLSIPSHDTIVYVITRILETFVGVFVAIMINSDLPSLKKAYDSWQSLHKKP